ncbi:hypothetical protein BCU54_018915 [Vibrio lentus]|nr:hypothetical protein [Vibrio lentus]PMH96312.1 hypothetical protein BCU54_07635 [Vibrio lentus]
MLQFLTSTAKAGFTLAAIAAAVFWSLHEGFIQAKIFSQMTSDQTYNAFIWSSSIAGFLLFVAILLSTGSKNSGKTISADNGGTAIDNSGFLTRFKFLERKSKDENGK